MGISEPFRPPDIRLTGSKTFCLFVHTAAGAGAYTILSHELPYPATLVSYSWGSTTANFRYDVVSLGWGIIQAADAVFSEEATQIPMTDRRREGTSPPDTPGDLVGFPLPPTGQAIHGPIPIHLEVPGPGWRLYFRAQIQLAATERCILFVTVHQHTIGAFEGVIPIRPRGTPQEPLCIPVCIVGGAPGPDISEPITPGPPVEPPAPAEPDILAPPLPPLTEITPQAPMARASNTCLLVR